MSLNISATSEALAILVLSLALYYFYFCVVTRKLEARGLASRSPKLQAVLGAWWGRPLLALGGLAIGFALLSILMGLDISGIPGGLAILAASFPMGCFICVATPRLEARALAWRSATVQAIDKTSRVLKKTEEGRGFSPAEKCAPIFSIIYVGASVRRG